MSKQKMYQTTQLLTELLAKQHQERYQTQYPGLFRQGTFTLPWRAKVGSFPSPDTETLISAGEPCGRWDWRSQAMKPQKDKNGRQVSVPEDFAELGKRPDTLPLNGYVPGSAIRGVVRAWALAQAGNIPEQALKLLGQQTGERITSGKVVFLDAWPSNPEQLTVDVVNPQQDFQVYHKGQADSGGPHALYSLGDGQRTITVTVTIRGIPGKAEESDVNLVWEWTQKALNSVGIGGRTPSGYGALVSDNLTADVEPEVANQAFEFELYSQGCWGPRPPQKREKNFEPPPSQVELRPSHWRGWLRSWTLRFLLGVMSANDAEIILQDLFGTLESIQDELEGKSKRHRKGCIRIQMFPGKDNEAWGSKSTDTPTFYVWKGQIKIAVLPRKVSGKRINTVEFLNEFLLPIIQIACSVGGVGHGWRRPLHQFQMEWTDKKTGKQRRRAAARGSHVILKTRNDSQCQLEIESSQWKKNYQNWIDFVKAYWPDAQPPSRELSAEVFSQKTCAVYVVPGPRREPISFSNTQIESSSSQIQNLALTRGPKPQALARGPKPNQKKSTNIPTSDSQASINVGWAETQLTATRGEGMRLVYDSKYKENKDLGGTAAKGGESHCSWATLHRVSFDDLDVNSCHEIVCVFMGGVDPETDPGHLRSQFLGDLATIPGAIHLFGVQAPFT